MVTFCYFKHLKNFYLITKLLPMKLMNKCIIKQLNFETNFKIFNVLTQYSFFIKPYSKEDLDLSFFEWIDMSDFLIQMIDFKKSLMGVSQFVYLEKII